MQRTNATHGIRQTMTTLAIGLIALLLIGCGGRNNEEEQEPASLPTSPPVTDQAPQQQPVDAEGTVVAIEAPGDNAATTPLIAMGGSATTIDPSFYHFELSGVGEAPPVSNIMPCNQPESVVQWVEDFDGGSVPILSDQDPGRNRLEWCACGFENQDVNASIMFPTEFELEPLITFAETDENICAEFRYSYPIDTPPGLYQIIVTDADENVLLEDTVTMEAPEGAIVDWVGSEVAWMSGFIPGESVLLRYYEQVERRNIDTEREFVSYRLVDQQNAVVSPQGTLIAQVDVYPVGINVDPIKVLAVSGGSATAFACSPSCGYPIGNDREFVDAIFETDFQQVENITEVRICEPTPLGGCNDNRVLDEGVDVARVQVDYAAIPEGSDYELSWGWRPLGDQGNFDLWDSFSGCQWLEPGEGSQELTLSVPEGLRSGEWMVTITSNEFVLAQEIFVVQGTNNLWQPPSARLPCPEPEAV